MLATGVMALAAAGGPPAIAPFADVFRFALAYAGLILFPGIVLSGFACPGVRPLDRWMLALVLGMLSSSGVYWVLSMARHPQLVWAWPLVAAAAALRQPSALRGLFSGRFGGAHAVLLLVVAAVSSVLVAGPIPYRSLSLGPDGRFSRGSVDAEFHLAIVRELMHTVPPQSPFTSGTPLLYHYAGDLTGALLACVGGLEPGDLIVRFLPPVLLAQLVLAVFCFARLWLGSELVAALVAGLSALGGDLTWVVTLLCGTPSAWDAEVFKTPTLPGLYAGNPMLPAVGCLFAGLFALVMACRSRSQRWVGVSALVFAALIEYKVFTGYHVATALAGTAIWARGRGGDRVFAVIAAFVGLVSCYSAVSLFLAGRTLPQAVRFMPFHLLDSTLNATCVLPSTTQLLGWHPAARLAFLLGIVLPLYVLGSLGPRLLGAACLSRALARKIGEKWRGEDACWFFLAAFVVIGLLVTAAFQVTRQDVPGSYNNSVWFLVDAKYVMWIFVGGALMTLRRRGLALGVAALVVGLSVPSTVAWACSKRVPLPTLDAEELAMVQGLAPPCSRGATVVPPFGGVEDPSSSQAAAEVIGLAGCRLPLAGPFAEQFISRAEWDERQIDMRTFWKAWRKGAFRADILQRYGASLIVAEGRRQPDAGLTSPPGLQVLFAGARYTVYSAQQRLP